MKGTILNQFKIIRKIGEGGMGEVYLANDLQLDRKVAIKFLSERYTRQSDILERFEREARAAAALNHQNIVTIYEVNQFENQKFIVMEYVDGETLRDKIDAKNITLEEFILLTSQICQGLYEAHEAGIVHRDIKPENILITKNKLVKIVDFGLAKLRGLSKITDERSTLGTICYLSPEQLQGKPVTLRTDIWALGVIMYEMATGDLPFSGKYEEEIIYDILNKKPESVAEVQNEYAPEIARIIEKCLEKDTLYRYQSVLEIFSDLQRVKRDIAERPQLPDPKQSPFKATSKLTRKNYRLLLLISIINFIVILFILKLVFFSEAQDKLNYRISSLTSFKGLVLNPTWSPDSRWIAYTSNENGSMDIWKVPFSGGAPECITTAEYNEIEPDWSPDGKKIVYSKDGKNAGIHIIPSEGGESFQFIREGTYPRWSPDNKRICYRCRDSIKVIKYPEGDHVSFVSGISAHPYTIWTPDSKKILFWHRTKGDIYAYFIEGGLLKSLQIVSPGHEVTGLTFDQEQSVLYFCMGPFGGKKDLFKVSIDPETCEIQNEPAAVCITPTEDIQCMISPDGQKIAYVVRQVERHLYQARLNRDGFIVSDLKRITKKSSYNYYPAFSGDERNLSWTSHRAGKGQLFVMNLFTGEENKVTKSWDRNIREIGANFAPDCRQISYASTEGGSYCIWRIPSVNSVGIKLTFTQEVTRDIHPSWSPVDERIVFFSNRSGNWGIWSYSLKNSSGPNQLIDWPESNELYPDWHPSGEKISFCTNKSGSNDIWIMNHDGGNPKALITSPDEESWSAWSPSGDRLYFVSYKGGLNNIFMYEVQSGDISQITDFKRPDRGLPEALLLTKFDVSNDKLILPVESRESSIYLLEFQSH
jgi:serine/threonine protein kinase